MKGITTIAALPSGAGQAAALPAEVGEAKPAPKYKVGDVVTLYFGGNLVQTGLVIKTIVDGHVECEEKLTRPRNPAMDALVKGIHASPAFAFDAACKAIREAVDPATGEKGGRNRKQIEFGKPPPFTVTVNVSGSVNAKTRAQLAGELQTFRFRDWKGGE